MSKSREPQEVVLYDGDEAEIVFRITPFSGSKGFDLLPDVIQLLSGPVGSIVDAFPSVSKDTDEEDLMKTKINGKALAEGLSALAGVMKEKNGSEWVRKLLGDTIMKEGQGWKKADELAVFNTTFQGNYILLLHLIVHVIKINYLKSLGGLGKNLSDRIQAFLPDSKTE